MKLPTEKIMLKQLQQKQSPIEKWWDELSPREKTIMYLTVVKQMEPEKILQTLRK